MYLVDADFKLGWVARVAAESNPSLPSPPIPPQKQQRPPVGRQKSTRRWGGVRKRLWEEVGRLGQGVLAGGLEVHGNNVNKKLASDKKGREICHDFNPNVIAPVVIVHQATLLLDIPPGFL